MIEAKARIESILNRFDISLEYYETFIGWPAEDGNEIQKEHHEFCTAYGHAPDRSHWPKPTCARCGEPRKP